MNEPPVTPNWSGIAASTAAASPLGIIMAITLASHTGIVRDMEKNTTKIRITNKAMMIAPAMMNDSAFENWIESPI